MKITSSSEIQTVKRSVPDYLWEDVFEYVYYDISASVNALVVDSHVDDYDADWCEVDGSTRLSKEVDAVAEKYAEAVTSLLFANYQGE